MGRGALFGAISITILTIILELISSGKFVKFPVMMMGIFACGIDGYGGFFHTCGSMHIALLYVISLILFLIVGLLAGVFFGAMSWAFLRVNKLIKKG